MDDAQIGELIGYLRSSAPSDGECDVRLSAAEIVFLADLAQKALRWRSA